MTPNVILDRMSAIMPEFNRADFNYRLIVIKDEENKRKLYVPEWTYQRFSAGLLFWFDDTMLKTGVNRLQRRLMKDGVYEQFFT